MTFFEEWRQILLSAFRHRTRTLLTAFGVFWGVFMVVLLLGIGKGLERGVYEMFKDDAINSVWVSSYTTSVPYQGFTVGRKISLTIEDLVALEKAIPAMQSVTPRRRVPLQQSIRRLNQEGSFPVFGVYPGYHDIERTLLSQGRLLNELDLEQRRRVIVIGETVAERLFLAGEKILGASLLIEGINFTVVGVFNDAGGEAENRRIYLPYSTMKRALDNSPVLDFLCFTIDGMSPQKLEQDIRRVLSARHNFSMADRSAIAVFNAYTEFERIQSLFTGIQVFIVIVGMGSLFAGLVSVSNIMMISVKERRKEIGLRKAIGATPNSIQMLILKEALLVAFISGYVGLVIGIGLIELIRGLGMTATFFRDPEVDTVVALSALIAIVLGGGLAGWIPARQAAQTSPIEALRND